MKITLLTLGKTLDFSLKALEEKYEKRLVHYTSWARIDLPELKNNSLQEAHRKEKEGELFLSKISASDVVVLLDERGKDLSSLAFAQYIEKHHLSSTKHLVFCIGGAFGFSTAMYNRADGLMALSKMTFTHEMIRLIFLEQLYRAHTILKKEKYHHN
jgi:23S rRNA (pseudouridine1915-N3)-methyltransferase